VEKPLGQNDTRPISVQVVNERGTHPVVLVCEHASAFIPEAYSNLGLVGDVLQSHISWDPGALDTAMALSSKLDAPLLHGTISRLIYDCNRPPNAPSAIPETSESTHIPGNRNLSSADRQERIDTVYRPFEDRLSRLLKARTNPILVTIHSFTPVYKGVERTVELGVLHADDARLADAMLSVASRYRVERNVPYGPEDGVMHTVERHAAPSGLLNVMIEIRNDLIAKPDDCTKMANYLADWLAQALTQVSEASL
jgi:predicted N-formylglutamate amidohydrolase